MSDALLQEKSPSLPTNRAAERHFGEELVAQSHRRLIERKPGRNHEERFVALPWRCQNRQAGPGGRLECCVAPQLSVERGTVVRREFESSHGDQVV